MAKIFSNYDYITNSQKNIIESDLGEKLSVIQDNLLDFQIRFNSFDWARDELERISVELVSMGRYFATQQGLWETHNLINHIKAEVSNNYGIKFYNDARNSRNEFYAGHHEYGFKARDGSFVEARPFMRPALYAVSRASQGEFATILEELLRNVFTDGAYNGIKNLSFGKELGHFHQGVSNPNLTLTRMMESSTLNPRYFTADHSEKKFRNQYSVRRTRFSDKISKGHKQDLDWRMVKGSVRSGRNINRSNTISRSYARGNNLVKKSRVTVIEGSRVSNRKYSLTRRKISKEEQYTGNMWRAQDGYQSSNRHKVEMYQQNKFGNINIERVRPEKIGEHYSYSKTKSNVKFTTKKKRN